MSGVEEKVFRASDGFDIGRVIDELENYDRLASGLGFSAVLTSGRLSTEVRVRLRRPYGAHLLALAGVPPTTALEVLGRLCAVEIEIPRLFDRLLPEEVYYDRDTRRVALHGVLLGWHAVPVRGDVSVWARLLAPGAEHRFTATSFRELRDELAEFGWFEHDDVEVDVATRVARLRRQAVEASDPSERVGLLLGALELEASRDLLGEVLAAAVAAKNAEQFDQAVEQSARMGVTCDRGREAALLAWRAIEDGKVAEATDLATAALRTDVRPRVALEVLVRCAVKDGDLGKAGALQLELIRRCHSPDALRRGLRLALHVEDSSLAMKMFQAYEGPLSAQVLLIRARIEEQAGDRDRAMSTLYSVAREFRGLLEEQVEEAMNTAEQAVRFASAPDQVERMLNLIEVLRRSAPTSTSLIVAQATYLLAARLDDRCEEIVPLLPKDASADRIVATLRLRQGRYEDAARLGLKALRAGALEPELLYDLMACARFIRDADLLEQVRRFGRTVIDESPELTRQYRQVAKEIL